MNVELQNWFAIPLFGSWTSQGLGGFGFICMPGVFATEQKSRESRRYGLVAVRALAKAGHFEFNFLAL